VRELKIEIPTGFSNVLSNQIQGAATAAISTTMMVTKSRWEQIAQQKLTTTRADYLLGLSADNSMVFPDAFTGVLTLRGKWPNKLETGFEAYDMKDGFKGSSRKKINKDGSWYLTIPFRHRTPGTSGSAVGGQAMPDDIYSQARTLKGGERLRGTETNYPPGQSWTGYAHKSGIYENMKKVTKTYDKATQSQYMTFRRVGENSDPQSWWHPGYAGLKALDTVEPFARKTFQQVFNRNVKDAMG
jgi:hypothetical protein